MKISLRRALALVALFGCLSFAEARAAWRAAGNVTAVAREADGVLLTLSSGARARVSFYDLDVVRVRLAPRGAFERDFSYAREPKDRKIVAAVVRETREAVTISTRVGGPRIVIRRRPFLVTVLDAGGRTIARDDPARPARFDAETGAVETSKLRDSTETYYGFGEKALPLSREGRRMEMWNSDTFAYPPGLDPLYQSIPFFVALGRGLAHGVFLDNTARTYFDTGKADPARLTFGASGGELNYYVFSGGRERTPKKVLEDYTNITGRMPLPPLWALGYHQSRYSYFPESRVREIAREFRRRRIPADAIHLDIDYMDGYRDFTWDKRRFPAPARMLKDLFAEGFRTVLIVDPGVKVDENYPVYREGRAGGHFHKTADGREFRAKVWPGLCAFPDFTNPKAREWFASYYAKHLAEGAAGFWNDMNEPATFAPDERAAVPYTFHDPHRTFPLDVRHHGDGTPGDHARYHNVYGMQMARSTFEGLRRLAPERRPFVLTRAGYAGVQRFAAVWTGDNVPSWEHLQLSIPMLTNLGVSGVPFVGADVGGFAGDATAELYTRWLQAAALAPFFRTHVMTGKQDREPWSFGEEAGRINREAIELRYRLLPHIYSLFEEHAATGAPVMRPLWFNYPHDPATHTSQSPEHEEFMLGSDLLVAPVMRQGETRRPVYFPRGDLWLDWWTGARYEGGTTVTVDAPLSRLPLFVRAGAAVLTQPVVQHTGEMARAPLSLVVAHGRDGRSEFYEDAGDGYEYKRGAFRRLKIDQSSGDIILVRSRSFTQGRRISGLEILNVDALPREILIDDARVKVEMKFDAERRRLSIASDWITNPEKQITVIKLIP